MGYERFDAAVSPNIWTLRLMIEVLMFCVMVLLVVLLVHFLSDCAAGDEEQ